MRSSADEAAAAYEVGLEVATNAMVAGALMTLPLLPWGWREMVTAPATGNWHWLACRATAIGVEDRGCQPAAPDVASAGGHVDS